MGILSSLERIFVPSRGEKAKRVDLKEIYCRKKGDDFIKKFKSSVVGSEYKNPDGSDRQEALRRLKVGEKVRLIWDAGNTGGKHVVYLVRKGKTQRLSISDCFGRLNDKTAADLIRWLTQENIVTSARVAGIVGGTRKRPKLGCILELTTYHGPQ
jgi:hypothetical protein